MLVRVKDCSLQFPIAAFFPYGRIDVVGNALGRTIAIYHIESNAMSGAEGKIVRTPPAMPHGREARIGIAAIIIVGANVEIFVIGRVVSSVIIIGIEGALAKQ